MSRWTFKASYCKNPFALAYYLLWSSPVLSEWFGFMQSMFSFKLIGIVYKPILRLPCQMENSDSSLLAHRYQISLITSLLWTSVHLEAFVCEYYLFIKCKPSFLPAHCRELFDPSSGVVVLISHFMQRRCPSVS